MSAESNIHFNVLQCITIVCKPKHLTLKSTDTDQTCLHSNPEFCGQMKTTVSSTYRLELFPFKDFYSSLNLFSANEDCST